MSIFLVEKKLLNGVLGVRVGIVVLCRPASRNLAPCIAPVYVMRETSEPARSIDGQYICRDMKARLNAWRKAASSFARRRKDRPGGGAALRRRKRPCQNRAMAATIIWLKAYLHRRHSYNRGERFNGGCAASEHAYRQNLLPTARWHARVETASISCLSHGMRGELALRAKAHEGHFARMQRRSHASMRLIGEIGAGCSCDAAGARCTAHHIGTSDVSLRRHLNVDEISSAEMAGVLLARQRKGAAP